MQIDGLALDKLDGLLAEEAGDDEFFYFWRRGNDGGKSGGGIGADGDGDFQAIGDLVGANGDVSFSPTQARRGLEWATLGFPISTQATEGLNGAPSVMLGGSVAPPPVSAMMATRAADADSDLAAAPEAASADWRRRSR